MHLGSRRGEAPLMVAVDLRLGNIRTAFIVDDLDVLQVIDNAAELDWSIRRWADGEVRARDGTLGSDPAP